ncbi:MAG: MrfA Zn-binding domain, partial [Chloroflexota bacterium]|nr:MrfA Zn-binding domain [Chloroflexota bacterium]
FKRHEELIVGARALIEACGCEGGCPACTGPRLDPTVNGKSLALRLLAGLMPPVRTIRRREPAPEPEPVAT